MKTIGFAAVAAGIAAVGKSAVEGAAQFEMYQATFTSLLGSAGAATKMMARDMEGRGGRWVVSYIEFHLYHEPLGARLGCPNELKLRRTSTSTNGAVSRVSSLS